MDLGSIASESAWVARLARSPFAAALAKGGPLIVVRGEPPRLAFATATTLEAFGVADDSELEQVLFGSGGFGARRLGRLARDAGSAAPPRLELLSFFVARKPVNVRWLCARVAHAGESYFVAAEPTQNMAPGSAEISTAAQEEAPPVPELAPPPVDQAAPFQSRPLDGPIRFIWRLDARGRFGPTDAAVVERMGPFAPRMGESVAELTARAGFDEQGEFQKALATQATFSALRLAWPEPGRQRARVVLLSGAPSFEGGAGFQGFRGFGIFTGEAESLASAASFTAPAAAQSNRPDDDAATEAEGPRDGLTPPEAPENLHEPTSLRETDPAPGPVEQAAPSEPGEAGVKPAHASSMPEAPEPRPAPPGGDAVALLTLLQRQHAPPANPAPANPAGAPALAIIAALAALLQPKAGPAAGPAGIAASPVVPSEAPKAESGAEIVPFRPHSGAPANDAGPAARESASVSLSSQERDAFKEIARALGANVRGARSDPDPPDVEPAEPHSYETAEHDKAEPVSEAAPHDLSLLLDTLPIAALVIRNDEALYANATLLELTGYASLEDFRRREGLKAIFRGRDPEALAPGGAAGGIPLVAAGDRLMTVDAQVRSAVWRGAPAVVVALRRSYEADHQAELRALERETAMHAARARDFATALDAARDGMARLDSGGRLLGLNKGAERLFGYDQNEMAGESFLSLFAPGAQPTASAALQRLVRGEAGPGETFAAEARDRAGRIFPARFDIGRIASQPEPDFFLLITDQTEKETGAKETHTAREEAVKASAEKTELLTRVSHEMRTPLHAIMGFAEVILEERFGPIGNERYRDYIKDIHTSSRHVLSLANDLLDLTKIELGKLELQFSPIDVNRIIRECVTLMQPQAARERIIMRLSLFDRLPNVMADERSLRQIMLNLMSNAVKYNEPGGQVIVSTAIDDAGSAIVRVRDTGIGMNESELAIALQPFRRVPGAKVVEGSGLGLPLTKALAEANHADFSIKSRRDQGTLVEIAFPARKAAQ